ncbi:MAG: hypothetical protein FWG64_14130 [Firmicutes bacterium]|nr:hypothetical protein [Bacillota bacterium]
MLEYSDWEDSDWENSDWKDLNWENAGGYYPPAFQHLSHYSHLQNKYFAQRKENL